MTVKTWRPTVRAWLRFTAILMTSLIDQTDLMTLEPSFDSPMANVTVKEMATAILPCSVKFIGKHQVVWTDEWSTLLTFEDRRIIDDERLSVERPFIKDWNLHIRDVKYKDQGLYNCQVNTNPVKLKTVYLRVQVPAKILNNASTDALIAREGTTVTIICNVSGIPMPTVTWHRMLTNEKGEEKKKIGMTGEVLIIYNISRLCGGVYECEAYNGVPPAVSRLIRVSVEFPPEINLPNDRIGQDTGKETILECSITANPQAVGVWKKNGVEIKTQSGKFRIEPYTEDDQHTIVLSLRIMVIEPEDYGVYTCEASNKLGTDNRDMILYDYSLRRPHHMATTTVTTTASISTVAMTSPLETYSQRLQQQHSSYHGSNVVNDQVQRFDAPKPSYENRGSKSSKENRGCKSHMSSSIIVLTAVTASIALISDTQLYKTFIPL